MNLIYNKVITVNKMMSIMTVEPRNPFIKITQEEEDICQKIVQDISASSANVEVIRRTIFETLSEKKLNLSIAYKIKNAIVDKSDLSEDWIERLVLNHLCPGFSEKKLEEQILIAKQQNNQAALAFQMLQSHDSDRIYDKFTLLGLTSSEALTICKELLKRKSYYAKEIISHLDKLGLENWDVEDRLNLVKEIAKGPGTEIYKQKDLIISLIYRIKKFSLENATLEQRLVFFKEVLNLGKEIDVEEASWNKGYTSWRPRSEIVSALLENFNDWQLSDATQENLLSLFIEIAHHGQSAAMNLVFNFQKLGLKEENTEPLLKEIAKQIKYVDSLAFLITECGLAGPEKKEQRLSLIKEFLKKGEFSAVAEFIFELKNLNIKDSKEGLAIFLEFLKLRNAQDVVLLIEHFDRFNKINWQIEDLLFLAKEILKNEGWEIVDTLLKNFDKFGLKKATQEERLTLLTSIPNEYAIHISSNFDKLGFIETIQALDSPTKRIDFCIQLMNQGEWVASGLANNFDKLGLQSASQEERLSLCAEIAKKDLLTELDLSRNFDKLGFIQDILKLTDISQRYLMCHNLAMQGAWAATGIAANFNKMGLKDIKVDERLSLCVTLVRRDLLARQKWLENSLAENFSKLGLLEIIQGLDSVSSRIAFCIELMKQGEWVARGLAENFDKLGLKNATIEERFSLSSEIAQKGFFAETALSKNFDKLGFLKDILKPTDLRERLSLCNKTVMLGAWAAKCIAAKLEKLGLKEASVSERLSLCYNIVNQGEEPAANLAKNLDTLGLESAKEEDLLSLYKVIVKQGEQVVSNLLSKPESLHLSEEAMLSLAYYMASLGMQRDFLTVVYSDLTSLVAKQNICLALLTHHSPLRGLDGVSSTLERNTPLIAPLFGLLCKAEGGNLKSEEVVAFETFVSNNPKLSAIKPLIVDIKKKEPRLQLSLLQWAAFAAATLCTLTENQAVAIDASLILKDIYKHQNPSNRYNFMRNIRTLAQHHLADLQTIKPEDKTWTRLSILLITSLYVLGLEKTICQDLLSGISSKDFRDTKRFNALIQFIQAVINEGSYKKEELASVGVVIKEVLNKKPNPALKSADAKHALIVEISDMMQSYSNILQIFGKDALLHCIKTKQSPQSFFVNSFKTLFKLDDEVNFLENYQKTFADFRDPMALFTYLRSVNRLPKGERERVHKVLNDYVNAVLGGTFSQVRYHTEDNRNPHLKQVFASKEGLKRSWLESAAPYYFSKEEAEVKEAASKDYKNFFIEKIVKDRQLNPDEMPLLIAFLNNKVVKVEEVQDSKIQFQNLAIQLCQGKIIPKKFVEEVQALKDFHLGPFHNDLNALNLQTSMGEYEISESDDPCDLHMLGTEIKGSCQKIDGDSHLNKSLPSYLMNGEIRAIVVKQGGRIIARSVLRLMIDDSGKVAVPILLQERIYSNVNDPTIDKYINDWAVAKAAKMDITLVSKEIGKDESNKPYQGVVKFLGGYAPFVYSDALGAGKPVEGPFVIDNCHVLFSPAV